MELETERLTIIPLTLEQLRLLAMDMAAFEKRLALRYDAEPIEGFIREYLGDQIQIIEKDASQWLWTAFWLIVRKADRVAVGSIAFKGKPDATGTVEIGYGLAPQHEHRGYMTEAAGVVTDWALAKGGAGRVIAQTDIDGTGPASQRILKRIGYERYRFGNESWWKKEQR